MRRIDAIRALNDALMLKDVLTPLVAGFTGDDDAEVTDDELEAAFATLDANIDDAKALMARLRAEAAPAPGPSPQGGGGHSEED